MNELRIRLRQSAELPEILTELRRALSSLCQPDQVDFWSDAPLMDAWGVRQELPPFDPADPLVGHVVRRPEATPLSHVSLESAVVDRLRAANSTLLVPLVSLGEFVGLIALGPKPAGSDYTEDEIAHLESAAALAAAALRVSRLTQQHEASAKAWQSNAEELRIAQRIQQSLLPETLPQRVGWTFNAHYRPARVIGGDLYDFISLPGDLLGLVFGDASDKSVPAALMMATARTLLRSAANQLVLPGQVLARVNDDLCAQIPPGMFVTCFIAILDPSSGKLRYANAGHCPPFVRAGEEVIELRASGWPLGMMPGVSYDEGETTLPLGSTLFCYSDGLIESHGTSGEMFGAARVAVELSGAGPQGVIQHFLEAHGAFVGPEWDQEDDLTLMSITRDGDPGPVRDASTAQLIADFSVPSAPDIERAAAERVLDAIRDLPLTQQQRARLGTAVAESVMNAAEHGNHFNPDLPVSIQVFRDANALRVRISDRGRRGSIPDTVAPDLDAKLAGLQSPRGWGLFLIEKMVDGVAEVPDSEGHTIELTIHFQRSEGQH